MLMEQMVYVVGRTTATTADLCVRGHGSAFSLASHGRMTAQHIRVIGQPLMRPVSDDSEQCVACSLHFKIPDGVSFNLVICYVLH